MDINIQVNYQFHKQAAILVAKARQVSVPLDDPEVVKIVESEIAEYERWLDDQVQETYTVHN